MDQPYDSYQNSSEDLPKDLTIKTAKKLKPIPPPLNLSHVEAAKISSTSPKSPMIQKHLPFRKRAHSISANLIKQDSNVIIPPTLEENIAADFSPTLERVQSSPLFKLEPECCFRQNSEIYFTSNTDTSCRVGQYVKEEYRIPVDKERDKEIVFTSTNLNSGSYRSHIEQISNNDLKQDGFVLDLSTNHNSVLLSPAPSSLGSSREELADAAKHSAKFISWGCPWPPPVWHCFQPGSKLLLGGCWRAVEELSSYPPDWPGELLVERLSLPRDNSIQITFCALSSCGEIIADISSSHAFLVKDKGWAAVCSDDLYKRYAVKCSPLQRGDIVVQPVSLSLPMPSPDICDRMKRFSFPTSEESQSAAVLLSPPTTPTRKTQDLSDKPKRPMNAFMLFAKKYRLELIQTNPGKDNRAISVILGEAWRTLPQEERDIFIQGAKDLSEEQKALYPDCWKRKRSHSTS